jgi:hypothetical protein
VSAGQLEALEAERRWYERARRGLQALRTLLEEKVCRRCPGGNPTDASCQPGQCKAVTFTKKPCNVPSVL